MELIHKLGLRRYLRIFWSTFRKTYYPKASERASDPRLDWEWGHCDCVSMVIMYTLVMGTLMIIIPTIALLTSNLGWPDCVFSALFIALGILHLLFPICALFRFAKILERVIERISWEETFIFEPMLKNEKE